MRKAVHLGAVALILVAAGCGAGNGQALERCVKRWNAYIPKKRMLSGIVPGTPDANVRNVSGRCVVTILGPDRYGYVFGGGHPEGVRGWLFEGAEKIKHLARPQTEVNATAGAYFRLTLNR